MTWHLFQDQVVFLEVKEVVLGRTLQKVPGNPDLEAVGLLVWFYCWETLVKMGPSFDKIEAEMYFFVICITTINNDYTSIIFCIYLLFVCQNSC